MTKNSPTNNHITKKEFDLSVNPLKIDVRTLKSDVKVLKADVKTLKKDVSTLKSDVAILKSDVSILKSDVAILKKSVLNIESKINIYSDMYEVNKWNSEKLANRVNKLEKHTGLTPPQEFLVSGI